MGMANKKGRASRKAGAFDEAMTRMASDPAIRSECAQIDAKFGIAALDGVAPRTGVNRRSTQGVNAGGKNHPVEAEGQAQAAGSSRDAVARILDLQKHVGPDPDGQTVKDYIDHGRP